MWRFFLFLILWILKQMITPLTSGNKICLVAPGRKVSADDTAQALLIFESWALEVSLGKNLYSEHHSYLSGTDQERLSDLQQALDDPSIKAIICARGGYGSSRIIDQIDFTKFKKHPKWIVGFSDITCFHLACSSMGIHSVHGAMPIQFSKKEASDSVESLRKVLFGEATKIETVPTEQNRYGMANAQLVGGNLSLLVDSLGTKYEVATDNKILVIEEVDEPYYKIDRMLTHLKRAGKFNRIAGLAVGHMTEIGQTKLPFLESVEEILLSKIDTGIPVAFNLPVGHEHPNRAWIQGKVATFKVEESGVLLG